MVNSRDKGKRGEALFRDFLRERGYDDARRGQQYSGTETSADVVGGPPGFHFECKFVERLNVRKAYAQARKDCGSNTPVVAHKTKRTEWLVTLSAEDFLKLVKP